MTAPRILRVGSRGRDVRAVQRALRKAGARPTGSPINNVFDETMAAEVRTFQSTHGLDADGEAGDQTFTALEPFFDAYGRRLLAAVTRELASPTGIRQRIVAAADVGVRNRDAIHYTQDGRRMQGVREQRRLPRFPEFEDCSSFATWCYWVAGAPDPNGRGYDGFGFTGTQVTQGTVSSNARPGDLVFYGGGSVPKHVAVYVGNGRVVSHGSEPGPLLLPLDYRSDRSQIRSYVQ